MKAHVPVVVFACLIAGSTTGAFGQSCTVPEGQVSWWKGEGDASDFQGSNDGMLVNGVLFGTGVVGQAFSLDGVNDYIRVPNASSLEITGELTIEAWVNPGVLADGQIATIVAKWGQSVAKDSYVLSLIKQSGNPIQVIGAIGNGMNADMTTLIGGSLTPGMWHHVAMTYDPVSDENVAYVDGQAVVSRPRENGVWDPPAADDVDLLIGRETLSPPPAVGPRLFKGLIDEVGIYNHVLCQGEIQAIFDVGSAGKCKDVITVQIDIKPGTEPNCFNNNGNGVIPVAILGAVDFDVTEIDADTVELEGMGVKAVGKSNKLLATIQDVNADTIDDLVVLIEDEDGVFEEGDTVATITGRLLCEFGSTSFEGTDSICIVGGGGGGAGEVRSLSLPVFRRGDSNSDGATNISDPVFTLEYLFAGGQPPACRDAADADDDGRLDLADAVYSLGALFGGGTVTSTWFGLCDHDWTRDELDCQAGEECAAGD